MKVCKIERLLMHNPFKKNSKKPRPVEKQIIKDANGIAKKVIINGEETYTCDGRRVAEETYGVLKYHPLSIWMDLIR